MAKKTAIQQTAYCPDNPEPLQPDVTVPAESKPVVKTKSAQKPTAKPTKPTKPTKPVKERTRGSEHQVARNMLLEKKHTDEVICDRIRKECPERTDNKQIMKAISAERYFLNRGKRRDYDPKKNGRIERIKEVEKPDVKKRLR